MPALNRACSATHTQSFRLWLLNTQDVMSMPTNLQAQGPYPLACGYVKAPAALLIQCHKAITRGRETVPTVCFRHHLASALPAKRVATKVSNARPDTYLHFSPHPSTSLLSRRHATFPAASHSSPPATLPSPSHPSQ